MVTYIKSSLTSYKTAGSESALAFQFNLINPSVALEKYDFEKANVGDCG